MARNLPQFTTCAAPGDAHSYQAGDIALNIFGSLFFGAVTAGVYWVVMTGLGQAAALGCVLGIAFLITLIAGALSFKSWYYNARLMCIQHDQCAAGTIVGQPHDSGDGDRKVEILIAPFDVPETEQLLIETLDGMRALFPTMPDLVDLQNRQIRFGFVRGLSEADQIKIYLDLVDNHMFNQPGRDFLRHLWRRDKVAMGAAAFDNSPEDAITAAQPNPMFRIGPDEGGDPEEHVLVPYMHCEVEGNRLEKQLDNAVAALVAALAAFTTLCVICEVVTLGAGDWLCGWIGAGLAALFGFLIWLLAGLINDPDNGVASEVGVDVEDPDFDTPPTMAQHGDIVYLFGDWVMDEEHNNYFELHPVKAWYLLCRAGGGAPEDWQLTEETAPSECEFDVRLMTGESFDRICRIVKAVETTDPKDTITIDVRTALAGVPPRQD